MKRHLTALVIGNAAYTDAGPLKNPTNDAEDAAARLEACGFSVIKETDCTFKDMDRALKKFKKCLEYADWWNPILAERLRIEHGMAVVEGVIGTGVAWNEQAVARFLT